MGKLLSIPNTLRKTKICNLHPKARRQASSSFLYGSPPTPPPGFCVRFGFSSILHHCDFAHFYDAVLRTFFDLNLAFLTFLLMG